MRRLTLLNAFSGVLQICVNIGLLLVTVPVFIHALGFNNYGLFSLITAIGGLGVFTNFGFTASLIKYLSEQGVVEESSYDIVTTFLVLSSTAVLVAGLLIVFRHDMLIHVFNIAPESISASVMALYVTCVTATVFTVSSQVPTAMLDSRNKVYVTNGIQLAVGVVSKLSMLTSLFLYPDLESLGWILLATSVVTFTLLTSLAYHEWGTLSCPDLGRKFLPIARKHFVYGRTVYATVMTGFFYEPMTKFLIGRYLGLTEVGYFDIAFRIKTVIWSVLERLMYPLLPLLAHHRSTDVSRAMIEEVQSKLALLIIPVAVLVWFASRSFVYLWIGASLEPVIVSIIAIVTCYLIALLYVPLYHYLTIKGHPQKTLAMQFTNMTVNIVIFFALVPSVGYYGAVSAYCVAILSSSALSIWYQSSVFGRAAFTSRDYAFRLAAFGVSLVVIAQGVELVMNGGTLFVLVLTSAMVIATLTLMRVLRLVNANDIERYIGRTHRFGATLEHILVRRA